MLGWAPSNSSFKRMSPHVIFVEEETQTWLEGVQANAPTVYPRLTAGQSRRCWPAQDRLGQPLLLAGRVRRTPPQVSFPQQDAGNIVMLAGAGVTTHGTRKVNAERPSNGCSATPKLVCPEHFEYPTRPGPRLIRMCQHSRWSGWLMSARTLRHWPHTATASIIEIQ